MENLFFVPLYRLFLTYGGIFRLTFDPKSFVIVSDPMVAKHILKENSKYYSKDILEEILDSIRGKGLIPAGGEGMEKLANLGNTHYGCRPTFKVTVI